MGNRRNPPLVVMAGTSEIDLTGWTYNDEPVTEPHDVVEAEDGAKVTIDGVTWVMRDGTWAEDA